MVSLLDELARPFEHIDADAARAVLAEHWGLAGGELTRLDTERDDTFRAALVFGGTVLPNTSFCVIKVAHPADAPGVIDLQLSAMEHARRTDPGIPIQRVVPTRDGTLSAVAGGRVGRVLTWIDGDLMQGAPRSPALHRDAGRMLGRLNRALSDFDHPAADRELAWDLARFPELLPAASDPLHVEVLERFAAETAPALATLPRQVVHNDAHPGNLLVDSDRLAAILDFGDIVRTARVCDLAVSLAYLVPEHPRPWPDVDAFAEGFESVVPLLPEERALLPMLMAARTLTRTLAYLALQRTDNGDLGEFAARNDRKLRLILNQGE
ncbi:MAG: phosphotransferase [Microbacteriaceae bacterium]|nr:phosphotransferase [Microbacteriaceae bacterium]